MERQSSGRHLRESPRKKRVSHADKDLRAKLKKSLKSHNLEEPSDNVKPTKPTPDNLDENETDEIVLERREKQIQYGKNTIAYHTYSRMIPKNGRKDAMPRTPAKHRKYSRRQWDGMIKNWKQMIHAFAARYNENDMDQEEKQTLVERYNENENDDMDQEEEGTSVMNWSEEVELQDRRRRVDGEKDDDGWRRRAGSTSTDEGLGTSIISEATSVNSLDWI